MKYSKNQWNEKLQEIMKMMEEDYPNGYELIITGFSAEIRSTLQTMCFINNEGMFKEKNMDKDINKTMRNVIASARIEGFEFTDEQITNLTNLIQQAEEGKITWRDAIDEIVRKYRKDSDE